MTISNIMVLCLKIQKVIGFQYFVKRKKEKLFHHSDNISYEKLEINLTSWA
jgi:hypothetical protein